MSKSAALPAGTVTFLFTDVEGSTRLLHELGAEQYATVLAGHRRIIRDAVTRHDGVEIDTQGDAFFVAFATAPSAVAAAVEAQAALEQSPIRVRMGVHTGTPLVTNEGYVGADVHRAARIAAAGHGGQVLVSSSASSLVKRDGLLDLGEHRLKDLTAAERIFQLGKTGFPPLKTLYRTNLPVPATPFIGRKTELAELLALLKRDGVRLLSLTGPGGAGKTRLALQAAAEVSGNYPDGIFWAGLSALRDPEVVLPTIAASLESEDTPAAHIGDKRMLLLLDNFEQVVAAAGDVAELLAVCPRLAVLVTSRERLHLAGEHVFAVPSLAERDSMSLFIERAVAVRSDFTAGDGIAAICRRLDNLPLAIEIAAARVNVLSPQAILERLEQRLPLLASNTRDSPERQRTLRATIQWSYELLTPNEQRLFAWIAVFAGGCTLEAAERVCEADLDTLASLVDKSLLRYSDGRYWMLETIREFGHEAVVQAGERDAVLKAHAAYFVEVAEGAESRFGTSEEAVFVELLGREQDNLRAALDHTRGSPLQLRLARALCQFWQRRGHHSEGRKWLRSALSRRDDALPVHLVGALIGAAALAQNQGDVDEAERFVMESIAVAKNANDRYLEARAIGSRANVALAQGEYPLASELQLEAETIFRELGHERHVAISLANRAYTALGVGDFATALALSGEALEMSRKVGDSTSVLSAGVNVALAAHLAGNDHAARHALLDAIELAREVRHLPFLTSALITAAALLVSNDPSTSAVLLAVADRACSDLMLELEPVEHELRAAVESQISQTSPSVETSDATAPDLEAVLDGAAARALDSLAGVAIDPKIEGILEQAATDPASPNLSSVAPASRR